MAVASEVLLRLSQSVLLFIFLKKCMSSNMFMHCANTFLHFLTDNQQVLQWHRIERMSEWSVRKNHNKLRSVYFTATPSSYLIKGRVHPKMIMELWMIYWMECNCGSHDLKRCFRQLMINNLGVINVLMRVVRYVAESQNISLSFMWTYCDSHSTVI